MSWKAIPDTRPRDSETSVTECVVCAWNKTRSIGRRAQVTSRPFRDQMYVVRQVRRCMTRQRRDECVSVGTTRSWRSRMYSFRTPAVVWRPPTLRCWAPRRARRDLPARHTTVRAPPPAPGNPSAPAGSSGDPTYLHNSHSTGTAAGARKPISTSWK